MKKELGLYVHIPFCLRKCAYCDFASFAGRERDMDAYIERVIREAEEKSAPDYLVSTLYIGGGTPSLLPPGLMDALLTALESRFCFMKNAEKTCECNPGTVTEPFLDVLCRHGVNRLSFGAQAYQDRLLSLLGRIHRWPEVEKSVSLARSFGIRNFNLDLMLGLPFQTLRDAEQTLSAALALSPTHLSCYGLIVEEGTQMKRMVDDGVWTLPDEDAERAMYECCRETLAANGFEQYEISNFSLPGFACRHNADCWERKEYLGLGSAACGFLNDQRFQNPPSLDDYLAGKPAQVTFLTPEDARFESVMLGLRMMKGVSDAAFRQMHGLSIEDAFGEKLIKPLRQGLVEWQEGSLRLTRRGMDVQNAVLVELM